MSLVNVSQYEICPTFIRMCDAPIWSDDGSVSVRFLRKKKKKWKMSAKKGKRQVCFWLGPAGLVHTIEAPLELRRNLPWSFSFVWAWIENSQFPFLPLQLARLSWKMDRDYLKFKGESNFSTLILILILVDEYEVFKIEIWINSLILQSNLI